MSVAQLDVALDRPLPQSPDAERAVLGSILINNHAFYRVVSTINTEDFFRDAHRTIFATMRRLAEQSREIDLRNRRRVDRKRVRRARSHYALEHDGDRTVAARRKTDHGDPHRLRSIQRIHVRVPGAGPDHHRGKTLNGKDVVHDEYR